MLHVGRSALGLWIRVKYAPWIAYYPRAQICSTPTWDVMLMWWQEEHKSWWEFKYSIKFCLRPMEKKDNLSVHTHTHHNCRTKQVNHNKYHHLKRQRVGDRKQSLVHSNLEILVAKCCMIPLFLMWGVVSWVGPPWEQLPNPLPPWVLEPTSGKIF